MCAMYMRKIVSSDHTIAVCMSERETKISKQKIYAKKCEHCTDLNSERTMHSTGKFINEEKKSSPCKEALFSILDFSIRIRTIIRCVTNFIVHSACT